MNGSFFWTLNAVARWTLNDERSLVFLNAERLNGIFFLNGNKPGPGCLNSRLEIFHLATKGIGDAKTVKVHFRATWPTSFPPWETPQTSSPRITSRSLGPYSSQSATTTGSLHAKWPTTLLVTWEMIIFPQIPDFKNNGEIMASFFVKLFTGNKKMTAECTGKCCKLHTKRWKL